MSDLTRSIPADPPTTDVTPPIAGAEPTTSDDWKGSPDLSRGANPGPAAPPGYELREEVGHGGMGIVYRARDVAFGRDVAVKVLADRFPADSPAAHRFVYEARITGQLQHPGIPAAHQVGTLPDGRPFLAMKLIHGRTLAALLRGRADPSHDRGRFVAAVEQVCQAVGYAHAKGVIHRDLKPANVMVGAFGEVQVMDWGLAKVLASGGRQPPDGHADQGADAPRSPEASPDMTDPYIPPDESLSEAGAVMGTPAYMAPEQARGEEVTARADVFALGGILCEVLTGKPPFAGKPAEALNLARAGNLTDAFARLDGCGADPDLVALAKRCLAPDPADRPADGGAVAAAVAAFRAAAEDRAKRAEVDRERAVVRAGEERKRRRVLLAAAGAVAGVLAAGTGVSAWQAVRATDAESKAVERETEEKKAREVAEEVARFMQEVFAGEGTRGEAGRSRDANKKRTVKEAMDQAAKTIGGRFENRPEVEAAVRSTIGLTYLDLGEYPEAEEQLRQALTIREQVLGPDQPTTLAGVQNLAHLYREKGDFEAAEPLYRRALTGFEKSFGPDHRDTLVS